MIVNRIYQISEKEFVEIISRSKQKQRIHIVELDGSKIQKWKDYIEIIEEKYEFPTTCIDSIDRYMDWMRDLQWLQCEEYIMAIHNVKSFLSGDPKANKIVMDGFGNSILPYWQEEVEKCCVGGKAKPFNVYLID